jgi:hypothetical protein
MNTFYENVMVLEKLRSLSAPAEADLKKVFAIIKDDVELTLYFYDVLGPGWVELLDKAGEFEELREKETGMIGKYKAHYLKQCAEIKAEAVLGIIEKLEVQDINIQGTLNGAIVKMPEEIAIKGIGVVTKYLDKQENKWWYTIGESATELMLKLVDRYPRQAFEIARLLLDVWRPGEKKAGVFETIRSKFATHEYKELIFSYYSKIWEKKPFEATCVLVDIYDKYLDECIKEKDYDVSEYLGVSLQDLEDIQRLEYDLDAIIMKAICEAGRASIVKEPQKVSELLEDLEKRNKGIFHRVEMYLLRFVPAGTEKERIKKIIGNQKFIESPFYKYEHRRLLNDKFDDVSDKVKKKFIDWVKKPKITEERKKEVTEWCQKNKKPLPDFEQWENRAKAEELYFVRERFKDEYKRYKEAAGVKDDSELAPRKMVSEGRDVSPMEGTPLRAEDMAKMKCEKVLDYLLDPKNYEGKEKVGGWGTVKDALAATFKNDVKKRVGGYLDCDVEKLVTLGPDFLSSLFYGFREVEKIEREVWGQVLKLAGEVVKNNGMDEKYRACYSAILSALRDGFREKEDEGIEFTEGRVKEFWGIIETLTRYPVGDISQTSDYERDPVQMGCVLVPGQAMELSVSLGVMCKKYFPELHESYLKGEIQECYEKVLKIKEPGINCRFGSDFARIYWTDTEWVKKNLGNIFSNDLWDETWGTYVSWGRPSPKCFELLKDQQYLKAVKRIGKPNKFKFGKDPDKGLIEHLMIGYFNGWIDYEHEVLQEFFEKAPADLRAKAARFLTTGFKGTKEGDDEKYRQEVAERMRDYWRKRIAVMDKEEAIGFMKWVSDSVLDGKETLEFLEKTLNISGGKLSEHENTKAFVEGVCKFGKEGNELLALQCFKKAAADENMHITWSGIQDPLVNFLGTIVDKPEDVRSAAIEVADAYGRYNRDKFHEVWEKLKGEE